MSIPVPQDPAQSRTCLSSLISVTQIPLWWYWPLSVSLKHLALSCQAFSSHLAAVLCASEPPLPTPPFSSRDCACDSLCLLLFSTIFHPLATGLSVCHGLLSVSPRPLNSTTAGVFPSCCLANHYATMWCHFQIPFSALYLNELTESGNIGIWVNPKSLCPIFLLSTTSNDCR